jgi:hypothetical protein
MKKKNFSFPKIYRSPLLAGKTARLVEQSDGSPNHPQGKQLLKIKNSFFNL